MAIKPHTKEGVSNRQAFLSEVQAELRKVEWPDRNLVIKNSTVVLFLAFFFSGFVAVIDLGLSRLFLTLKGF